MFTQQHKQMQRSSHGFQSKIVGAVFLSTAVATWLLLRGYHGLLGDAQIYAFQAFARIHSPLTHDLFLQNTSQDQFTLFSPVYAWFIQLFGLEQAARLLTLLFTICFLAAALFTARILMSYDGAWLGVIFLLIVGRGYGGSDVFRFSEEFLTARLPAEALIATSLAFFLHGSKPLALATATAALLIHPLIALPGLLLLMCLGLPIRATLFGAAACLVTVVLIALAAIHLPWVSKLLPIMDAAWLNVVQERSQFLFLQLWSFRDWELNARPFFYLAFIAFAVQDIRVRRLCIATTIVGVSGLAVGLLAGTLGPVAIFVQAQAWRWVWIAVFVSALLLPGTILQIWPDKKCGPLCGVLLVLGLTLSLANGPAFASLSLLLWWMRAQYSIPLVAILRGIFWALVAALAGWILMQSWQAARSAIQTSSAANALLQDSPALKILAVLSVSLLWRSLRNRTNLLTPTLLCAGLLTLSIFILPAAFKQYRTLASDADIAEFSDWERAIPPTSTVLVTPARDVGAFVWFTLQRPNYLSIDQSAGVVFSRTTSLEVQRRSEVLLPVMDPNWKIWTEIRAGSASGTRRIPPSRPLTATSLRLICADSQLGFVASPEDFGFDAIAHKHTGQWKDWNLYDCRKVMYGSAR